MPRSQVPPGCCISVEAVSSDPPPLPPPEACELDEPSTIETPLTPSATCREPLNA